MTFHLATEIGEVLEAALVKAPEAALAGTGADTEGQPVAA
jgi:hypothetical protein